MEGPGLAGFWTPKIEVAKSTIHFEAPSTDRHNVPSDVLCVAVEEVTAIKTPRQDRSSLSPFAEDLE